MKCTIFRNYTTKGEEREINTLEHLEEIIKEDFDGTAVVSVSDKGWKVEETPYR